MFSNKKVITLLVFLVVFVAYSTDNLSDTMNALEEIISNSKGHINNSTKISVDQIKTEKVDVLKKDTKLLQKSKPKKPAWITNFPNEQGYFVGIGNAQFSGDLETDSAKAINAGLNSLAGQIKVRISSEILTKTKEVNGVLEESASVEAAQYVKQNIEGIELVDAWYSKKEGV